MIECHGGFLLEIPLRAQRVASVGTQAEPSFNKKLREAATCRPSARHNNGPQRAMVRQIGLADSRMPQLGQRFAGSFSTVPARVRVLVPGPN
jgi:hypothetical protein